jgi:hypothetical protein
VVELQINFPSWTEWLTHVILGTWEADTGRMRVPGQPRQKVGETPSSTTNWEWWYMPVIPATQEAIGRTAV